MTAIKNNAGKPEHKYLHPAFLDGVAYAMMAGAVKYSPTNYLKGHKATDLLDAALRHIHQARQGFIYDHEINQLLKDEYDTHFFVTHLHAAAANINMFLAQRESGVLIDDTMDYIRPNIPQVRSLHEKIPGTNGQ